MKRNPMTSHQIPSDLFPEILALLPVNLLIRFKTVCKNWYTVIISPLFIQLHLQKSLESNSQRNRGLLCNKTNTDTLGMVEDVYQPSKFTTLKWPKGIIREYESAYSVGVCNGLACFRVLVNFRRDFGEAEFFLICNPSMRTFKKTAPPIEKIWPGPYPVTSINCFGYDSRHDDYKIVVTSYVVEDGSVRDMLIYSLKADSWKCVTPIPSPSSFVSSGYIDDPIFVNNMIHYRVYGVQPESIARFDLSSETWMDDLLLLVQVHLSEFGVLNGSIYVRAHVKERSTDVWIMEKQGGESESTWSKMLNFPPKYYYSHSPICRSKEGSSRFKLLWSYVLWWYDQQEKTSVPFQPETYSREGPFKLCITSLVSIPWCSLTKMQEIKEHRDYSRIKRMRLDAA